MFTHQVKYRGCIQVANFYPEPHQPRPGLIEANQCVKQCLAQVKQSTIVVLSVSADAGIKCVDTNTNPPRTVMKNSVYEIAHCGVDVSRPKMFTVIVGNKGEKSNFFCHIFKAESKEAASRVTVAVANACTKAFQEHKGGKGAGRGAPAPRRVSSGSSGGGVDPAAEARMQKMREMRRQSLKRNQGPKPTKIITKLTDSWFQPTAKREILNQKLKAARVGDFYVRESSTQVGNYAISVQTGKNIWTGLIHSSDAGFQLGNTKALLFDELTDLISYHMENTFMNDDYGYPMSLRPNKKQEAAMGAAAGGIPGDAAGTEWPDDEEDDILNQPGLSEAQQFEAFMNSKHVMGPDSSDEEDGPDMASMNAALGQLDSAQAELAQDDDDFNPRASAGGPPAPADDPFASTPAVDPFAVPAAAAAPPEPAAPPAKTPQSMAQAIFDALPKDEESCLGGNDIRPVLMGCGLEVADLGAIWMEVDQDRRGKIDQEQLCMILCMIQQKQAGQAPDLSSVDPNGPCPMVEGY